MASQYSFWQLGEELRGQSKATEEHQWMMVASKLAEQLRSKAPRINNIDPTKAPAEPRVKEKSNSQDDNKFETFNFDLMNLDLKMNDATTKIPYRNGGYNVINSYQKSNMTNINNVNVAVNNISNFNSTISTGKLNMNISHNVNNNSHNNNNNSNNCVISGNGNSNNSAVDKRFKTLPSTEMLPRDATLGGYIFVCNNDTMQEDLKKQLFGLPQRYRDSVRAITPGLPLFLYNYTTHQLHGIFEATSFGGSNIDPTAWEDKKCKGESRFPAQVRIRVRKLCKALDEDAFRPVLHHYDGPKFRLELSIPETLALLDLCEQNGV
ncbi:B2 protein [Amborella trichopoda]|uniref:DCD domain-containing protein n=2 Tax=Magnoliopsida TaxID=3398 RepID=U5DDZ3_AMBTC|nr:B2 protein [Amborella trichopoda]ERN19637.1 hypothetical protein AMTR_s00062p00149140 [Amborella trichopoda]|eukprot:XP_006858170.1 B2 protein [Amborella trichopoda]